MRLPGTVTFDLDGTLVDSVPDLSQALNYTLSTLDLPPVPVADVRSMVFGGARPLIRRGASAGGAILEDSVLEQAYGTYLAYYEDHVADTSDVFPSTRETLDYLASRGIVMAVCTNKAQILSDALLRALDLDGYFVAVLGADSVENQKPHANHIVETVARAGGSLRDCIHVGDNSTDVEAARNAGVPVVAVSYGYTQVPPSELGADGLIDDMAALPQAMARILENGQAAKWR